MENKFCPHCGASINQGAKFCGRCGKKLEGDSAAANISNGLEDLGKGVASSVQDITKKMQANETVQRSVKEARMSWSYLIKTLKHPNTDLSGMPGIFSYIILFLLIILPILMFAGADVYDYLPSEVIISAIVTVGLIILIILGVTYGVLKLTANKLLTFSTMLKQFAVLTTPLVVILAILVILNLMTFNLKLALIGLFLFITMLSIAINSIVHYNYPEGNTAKVPYFYVNVLIFIVLGIVFYFLFKISGNAMVNYFERIFMDNMFSPYNRYPF